jgi:hypothetical protein
MRLIQPDEPRVIHGDSMRTLQGCVKSEPLPGCRPRVRRDFDGQASRERRACANKQGKYSNRQRPEIPLRPHEVFLSAYVHRSQGRRTRSNRGAAAVPIMELRVQTASHSPIVRTKWTEGNMGREGRGGDQRASGDASSATGALLFADGGMTAP